MLLVTTDSDSDTDITVGASVLVPQIGNEHPNDATASLRERFIEPAYPGESLKLWMVTCVYRGAESTVADRWKWSTGWTQKVARVAYYYFPDEPGLPGGWATTKSAITTSAIGKLQTPIEYAEPYRILTVTRSMTLEDYQDMLPNIHACLGGTDGQGTVNQIEFNYQGQEYQPGEVRFVDETSEPLNSEDGASSLISTTFTFNIRVGGWADLVPDEDVCELQAFDEGGDTIWKRVPILNGDATRASTPFPLDGGGSVLEMPEETLFQDIEFVNLKWLIYDSVPYSLIGF